MTGAPIPAGFDIQTERLAVGRETIEIVRPRSAEDLIDEADFDADERLPYWAEVWPSGRVLADALAARPLGGARIVELGAGLAIPSLVAARHGARVVATDWYEPALAFVRVNAARLGHAVETMLVDWRDPSPELLAAGPFDLVVAADVLYEARHVEPLGALIPALAGPSGEVLIADPRRPNACELYARLAADGWRESVAEIPYSGRCDESGPIIELHSFTRRRPGGRRARRGDHRTGSPRRPPSRRN